MALNQLTDLALVNTNTNAGSINLPATITSQGRVISFKDVQGTFGRNNLTLICNGSDTFEDGGTTKVLRESYGSIQLVASGSKWYILNGTQVNTLQVSTLFTTSMSSFNVSTLNTTISTLSLIDNRFSTNILNISSAFASTQNVSTNFLYYNNYVIAGTRIGYSNVLNTSRFSVYALFPYLIFWLDASDSTTIRTSGSIVTSIRDKSPANTPMSVSGTPTYTLGGQNGLNVISVTNNGSFVTSQRILLSPLNQVSAFVVLIQSVTPNGNFEFFRADTGGDIFFPTGYYSVFDMFFTNGGGMNVNTNSSSLVYNASNITGSVNIYEFVYDGSRRTSYITGSVLVSGTSSGSILTISLSTLRILANITGYLCEAMYFQRAVSNIERQQVEGYLAWKWGLQGNLPASHPFKNAPPS